MRIICTRNNQICLKNIIWSFYSFCSIIFRFDFDNRVWSSWKSLHSEKTARKNSFPSPKLFHIPVCIAFLEQISLRHSLYPREHGSTQRTEHEKSKQEVKEWGNSSSFYFLRAGSTKTVDKPLEMWRSLCQWVLKNWVLIRPSSYSAEFLFVDVSKKLISIVAHFSKRSVLIRGFLSVIPPL